jgi:hypothetical protein
MNQTYGPNTGYDLSAVQQPKVTPDKLRQALELRDKAGRPALTPDQIFNHVKDVDPDLGRKLDVARQRGIGTGQILNYIAYGTSGGQPPPKHEKEFGEGLLYPPRPNMLQQAAGLLGKAADVVTAPFKTVVGGIEKGINAATGHDFYNQGTAAGEFGQNLDTTAGMAPAALGIIGGMAAGPLGAGAGAGTGQALKESIDSASGKSKKNFVQQAGDVAAATGAGVALDAGAQLLSQGVGKVVQGGKRLIQGPPQDEIVQGLVQPKATDAVVKQIAEKNPDLYQKGGFLTKPQILPDAAEKQLAETARSIQGFGQTADPFANAQAVKQALKSESQALKTTLEANDGVLSHKEVGSAVKNALDRAAGDFGEQEGVFQSIGKIWDRVSENFPGKLSGTWDARIEFDNELERRFGSKVFEKGTARGVAVRAARDAINQAVEQGAQRAGSSFAPQIQRLSQFYDILENLATKTGKDSLQSGLQKLMGTRTARNIGYGALGGIGAGVGYDLMKE